MGNFKRSNSAAVEINNALHDHAAAVEAIRGTVKGLWPSGASSRSRPKVSKWWNERRNERRNELENSVQDRRLKAIGLKRPTQTSTSCPLSASQPLCSRMRVALSLTGHLPRPGTTQWVPTPSSAQQAHQEHPLQSTGCRTSSRETVRSSMGKCERYLIFDTLPNEDDLTPEQLALYRQSRALEEDADPSVPSGATTRDSVRGSVLGSVRSSARSTTKAAGASLHKDLGLSSKESIWLNLLPPSPFVTMGLQFKSAEAGQAPIVLAEAQTVVDCNCEDADEVNAHSGTFHVVRRLDFLGAQPRE